MYTTWRRYSRLIGGLSAVVAVVLSVEQVALVLTGNFVGSDFVPLRNAATSLLHGSSVYSDPTFVYPPSAAPLLLPTSWGSLSGAFHGWVVLGAVGLLATAGLIASTAAPAYRNYVFAGAAVALVSGTAGSGSLFLGNLSILLVPVAAAILLSFERGRWTLGCALLALSLLLKPLLLPLLVIPAIRRRWLDLIRTMLPAAAVLLTSCLLVPGGRAFRHVLGYCLAGTDLHGDNAVNNLSLRGWGEAHHVSSVLGLTTSALIAIGVSIRLLILVRRCRHSFQLSPVWLANLVLLTTLLVGQISERHFLLVVIASLLLQVVADQSWRTALGYLPGFLIVGAPVQYVSLIFGLDLLTQSWLVGAELLLLAGALLTGPRLLRGGHLLILDELMVTDDEFRVAGVRQPVAVSAR